MDYALTLRKDGSGGFMPDPFNSHLDAQNGRDLVNTGTDYSPSDLQHSVYTKPSPFQQPSYKSVANSSLSYSRHFTPAMTPSPRQPQQQQSIWRSSIPPVTSSGNSATSSRHVSTPAQRDIYTRDELITSPRSRSEMTSWSRHSAYKRLPRPTSELDVYHDVTNDVQQIDSHKVPIQPRYFSNVTNTERVPSAYLKDIHDVVRRRMAKLNARNTSTSSSLLVTGQSHPSDVTQSVDSLTPVVNDNMTLLSDAALPSNQPMTSPSRIPVSVFRISRGRAKFGSDSQSDASLPVRSSVNNVAADTGSRLPRFDYGTAAVGSSLPHLDDPVMDSSNYVDPEPDTPSRFNESLHQPRRRLRRPPSTTIISLKPPISDPNNNRSDSRISWAADDTHRKLEQPAPAFKSALRTGSSTASAKRKRVQFGPTLEVVRIVPKIEYPWYRQRHDYIEPVSQRLR